MCAALTVLLLACSAGCGGDSLGPGEPPLSGTWSRLCGVDVACVLDLRLNGTTVSGRVGGIVNAGAPNYFADVSGSFSPPEFHLQWVVAGRFPTNFDGTLEGDSALVGTLSGFPDSTPAIYRRSR